MFLNNFDLSKIFSCVWNSGMNTLQRLVPGLCSIERKDTNKPKQYPCKDNNIYKGYIAQNELKVNKALSFAGIIVTFGFLIALLGSPVLTATATEASMDQSAVPFSIPNVIERLNILYRKTSLILVITQWMFLNIRLNLLHPV